jgi:5-formyltetrahydrofolate cyclo-ligase
MTEKESFRKTVRARVASIDTNIRKELSHQVLSRLANQDAWINAGLILGYLALKDEVDLLPALEAAWAAGKTVALPRYIEGEGIYCAATAPAHNREFVKGAFGILEPPGDWPMVALNQLDFILVPGVAFDLRGKRLGRGKGFYDRLLARAPGIKCGVALDEQIVDELPAEDHDISMNVILTPSRWLTVPPAGT